MSTDKWIYIIKLLCPDIKNPNYSIVNNGYFQPNLAIWQKIEKLKNPWLSSWIWVRIFKICWSKYKQILNTATSIYRLHFLSTSRVLLYRDTIDRVLFYIEMTVMMSDYPHKVLKLVCQAMVEIFANFVA